MQYCKTLKCPTGASSCEFVSGLLYIAYRKNSEITDGARLRLKDNTTLYGCRLGRQSSYLLFGLNLIFLLAALKPQHLLSEPRLNTLLRPQPSPIRYFRVFTIEDANLFFTRNRRSNRGPLGVRNMASPQALEHLTPNQTQKYHQVHQP